jgi:ABC-2 type transport system ATP-binding protein
LNLRIREGELFGFLGPNGAGKTTTIRLLLGFLRASSGRATVFGLDSWQSTATLKRDVGYLPGDLRLYPWLNARLALQIFGKVRGMQLEAFGQELATRFALEMTVPVRKMSRGMRQKLGLVLALAHRPRLLVLDEPTSGLDPLMQEQLADCLRQMAREGHTVFFSSHTLSEVEQLCDRVAIVRAGRIVADETLQALRQRARRAVTLIFQDDAQVERIEPPDFLELCQRNGKLWNCELRGPAPDLIRWASGQPIEDVTIGRPDLESLFRKFYNAPPEAS